MNQDAASCETGAGSSPPPPPLRSEPLMGLDGVMGDRSQGVMEPVGATARSWRTGCGGASTSALPPRHLCIYYSQQLQVFVTFKSWVSGNRQVNFKGAMPDPIVRSKLARFHYVGNRIAFVSKAALLFAFDTPASSALIAALLSGVAAVLLAGHAHRLPSR